MNDDTHPTSDLTVALSAGIPAPGGGLMKA
jgi:hypothetical protein